VGGLNYLNGERLPIEQIAELAHANDIPVGLDLAHAAGNVVLKLHDWEIDFACWCTYKYLNGGPGSIGACFVHEKHHGLTQYFQGWWGNRRENRFEMLPSFTATPSAAGWQVSNPPILALPPLKASLELFTEFGMDKLRQKSILLTGYLEQLIAELSPKKIQIQTPSLPDRRGAMLCIKLDVNAKDIFENVMANGIVIDYRRPNTIRVAPHPLYNTFDDCYKFVTALDTAISRF
jgi:kynureninase